MPENYITSTSDKGNISISEDVISVMVSEAVAEIEGVSVVSGVVGSELTEFLGIKNNNPRGIRITSENGKTVVSLILTVKYGYPVLTAAKKVQETVASGLGDMTGLDCVVNVHVAGISFDKTDLKG